MKIPPSLSLAQKPQLERANPLLAARQAAHATRANAQVPGATAGTAATGGPAQAPPTPIDLDQFFAAWGTDNAEFDVTQDGIVDAADLAIFLGAMQETANGGGTPQPETPTTPVTAQDVLDAWGQSGGPADLNGDGTVDAGDLGLALGNVPANPPMSLADGVQKAWGTSDPNYDLNKDGTVDAADLALALTGQPASSDASATLDGGPPTLSTSPGADTTDDALSKTATGLADAIFASVGASAEGVLSLDALSEVESVLGTVDSDRDGVVVREELVDRLTRRLEAATTADPEIDIRRLANQWLQSLVGSTEAELPDARMMIARDAYGGERSAADRLADRLHQRLAASGFGTTPPANLDRIVDGITPDRAMRAALMKSLATRYPEGLGVNAKV